MDVLRNFLFALRGVLQRHFAIPGQRPAVLPRENGAQTEKYVRARRNQEKGHVCANTYSPASFPEFCHQILLLIGHRGGFLLSHLSPSEYGGVGPGMFTAESI